MKKMILIGVLAVFAIIAVFALVITYTGYLPLILSIPWQTAFGDGINDHSYLIARHSFFVAASSGLILGLTLPVIFRAFKERYGKHDV